MTYYSILEVTPEGESGFRLPQMQLPVEVFRSHGRRAETRVAVDNLKRSILDDGTGKAWGNRPGLRRC